MQTQTLKAGTKKYLLLDEGRIARNTERMKRGEPVIMVVEVVGNTLVLHRCSGIALTEQVRLEYSQQTPLKLGRGILAHAAWVTTGEVILETDDVATDTAEALPNASASEKVVKPSKPAKPAATTPQE